MAAPAMIKPDLYIIDCISDAGQPPQLANDTTLGGAIGQFVASREQQGRALARQLNHAQDRTMDKTPDDGATPMPTRRGPDWTGFK